MAANNGGDPAEISNLDLRSSNFSNNEIFESEIQDSSYSLSLPSEPPDIRNWFSSYVYESPLFDSGDGFNSEENQSKGFSLEEIDRIKTDDSLVGGRNSLNGLVGCQRLCDEDNQENQGLNKGNQNHLVIHSDEICRKGCSNDDSLEGKQAQSHDIISVKDNKELGLNGRNALPVLEKTSRRTPEELIERRIAEEKILETKVPVTLVDDQTSPDRVASKKKSTRSSDDTENEGKVATSDGGFKSTRKNRIIRETEGNFHRRNWVIDENSRIESRISRIDGEGVGVVRKALSERTNIQCEPVVEIAGKWRCPRKNKPELGPPLKQLRLEQWVHRV